VKVLAMLLISQLTSCAQYVTWQGADGSKARMNLLGNFNITTNENYNGRGGLTGMFAGGRDGQGNLSRKREYTQTAVPGQPFFLHAGADGITLQAQTVDSSTHTGRILNGGNDAISTYGGLKVAGKLVDGTVDVINNGIDEINQ